MKKISGVADGPRSPGFVSSKTQMQPKWFLSYVGGFLVAETEHL